MPRFSIICAIAGATAFATSAIAHHPGGIGNSGSSGPINTISATTLASGVTVAAFIYDRIGLDALSDATLARAAEHAAAEGDDHAHVHSIDAISSPSLNIAHGLTDDLMFMLRLPYIGRSGIREGHFHEDEAEGEAHGLGASSGIGDVTALLQWRLLKDQVRGREVALIAGLKAPTGDTHETNSDGERFDAEFQPGSGSWDALAGLAVTQKIGAFSFDASALYTLTTTGLMSTDLGDRLHYGISLSYRLSGPVPGGPGEAMHNGAQSHDRAAHAHSHADHSSAPALDAILELNGEWHHKQETAGRADDNSGGHTLYVSPGLRLSQDRWSAFASVGLPIVNDLNGIQAEPDWRLVTGFSIGF